MNEHTTISLGFSVRGQKPGGIVVTQLDQKVRSCVIMNTMGLIVGKRIKIQRSMLEVQHGSGYRVLDIVLLIYLLSIHFNACPHHAVLSRQPFFRILIVHRPWRNGHEHRKSGASEPDPQRDVDVLLHQAEYQRESL